MYDFISCASNNQYFAGTSPWRISPVLLGLSKNVAVMLDGSIVGWGGTQIQDFNMVLEPWNDMEVRRKYGIEKNKFDQYEDKNNKYLDENGTFEQAILQGLKEEYGGKKYREFIYKNQGEQYVDKEVYITNSKPKNGGKWIDYVHVLQPPTYSAWGYGRIYIAGEKYPR